MPARLISSTLLAWIGAVGVVGCGGTREPLSVTALSRDTHVAFPISNGSHATADCNACHGEFSSFTQFSCLSCHEHDQTVVDPKHVAVAGYAYDSVQCYRCHPDGTAAGVDHTKIFPIDAASKHAGTTCEQCHVDPTTRAVVDCLACHQKATCDPAHLQVGGYSWTSPACLRCHGDSQVNRILDHPRDPSIRQGAEHYKISCFDCHPRLRTDKIFAAKFDQSGCSKCH